ncbi:MAG: ABC transporter permease subunit [Deltaproteobacteria bacterium]|nr:ABC transporter permease subunit [Deltaproteobacteria bacterium]
MARSLRLFRSEQPLFRRFRWGDAVLLLALAGCAYFGVYLGLRAPATVRGPEISLSPAALPWYAGLSLGRMAAGYALSFAFSLAYGYAAARSRPAEKILLPLLDVLQSVPILSFLPIVLLSLSSFLPKGPATELASIILIFTSQAWNLTFAWYQSLTSMPRELLEASSAFRIHGWLRFKTLELPFGAIGLIWNTVMSWAGGWFFLMAAESFTVGERDFRLPGLGAYLSEAAARGNLAAVGWGLATLVSIIVALDQLGWRPLLAWSERFKVEMVESESPPTSWFYDALRSSRLTSFLEERILQPLNEAIDAWLFRRGRRERASPSEGHAPQRLLYALGLGSLALAVYGAVRGAEMLSQLSPADWLSVALGLLATLARVVAALLLALAWTIPVGVLIGTSPRLAAWLQPLVQIAASVPATALFPVLLLFFLDLPGGLDLAAVLLMLLGTQWYLLFNVIAGASAIPQDLKYTASLLQLSSLERWRTVVLPALFPYVITGMIIASGGAWNASVVAEHLQFGGRTLHTPGVGSIIADAGARGDFPLLLAATLAMVGAVVGVNRFVWRRLYKIAEERYRME